MCEGIKHSKDIVTVPSGRTFFLYVVNHSYYHCVCDKGTGIVADAYLLFQMPCCSENSCWLYILFWCHCKPLAASWVVNVYQNYFIDGW